MKAIKNQTYEDLLTYLMEHQDKYVKGDVIIKYIPEVTATSQLREIINTLRTNGHPIVSSSNGYKLTSDKQEIMACIQTLTSRIDKIQSATTGMMDYLENNSSN